MTMPGTDALNLLSILQKNQNVFEAIRIISHDSSQKFYVGAGAITQTVWNSLFGKEPGYGIEDIDIIYHDQSNLDEYAEYNVIRSISKKLAHIPIKPDIKNQARVHKWFREKFGTEISPLSSIEDAVSHWPSTANSIAVRLDVFSTIEIIAPFGLSDLFSGIVRGNKNYENAIAYQRKAEKWSRKWPLLLVLPWEENT